MAADTKGRRNSINMGIADAMSTVTGFDSDGVMVWDKGKLLVEDAGVATGEDYNDSSFSPEEPDELDEAELATDDETEAYSEEFESKHPRDEAGMFSEVKHIGDLVHVKNLPGSTGPKLMKHHETGKHYVVKGGGKGGPERVKSEVLADEIYRLLGADVPKSGIIESDDGILKISEMLGQVDKPVKNLNQWKIGKGTSIVKEMHTKIAKHFVADCLLANWDVIGLELDNILVHETGPDDIGTPYRVDNGGTLRFRAQGSPKGGYFTPEVNELMTMRDKWKNQSSASVFNGLTGEQIIEQISHVLHHREKILGLAEKQDPSSVSTLKQRFEFLENLLHVHAEAVGKNTIKYSEEERARYGLKHLSHNNWNDLEASPEHVYHATNLENVHSIAASHLKPHHPSHGTDQSSWPDGSTKHRSYFTGSPSTAFYFAPEHGTPALLRMKRNAVPLKKESGTGDLYTEHKVHPSHLELAGENGQWHPLHVIRAQGTEKYGLKERIKLAGKVTDRDATHAQHKAGNYRKGVVSLRGLQVAIETPRGSWRHYAGELGKKQQMTAHYGYIKGTKNAPDGGKVDVFVGPDPKSDVVYVVDQLKKDGTFDEHKVMIGWYCLKDAKKAYLSNYEKGWTGMGPVTALTFSQFKTWLEKGNMKEPMKGQKKFYS